MEFKKEFVFAKKIIKEAGSFLLKHYNTILEISYKTDASWVTEIDYKTEEFIKNQLMSKFPNYGFIGEEGEDEVKNISWIVDPLDGTIAYTRHIPEFGIAIAFKKGQNVIFSVQYLPVQDLLLTAYKKQGAYCNGKRLRIKKRTDVQLLLSIKEQISGGNNIKITLQS